MLTAKATHQAMHNSHVNGFMCILPVYLSRIWDGIKVIPTNQYDAIPIKAEINNCSMFICFRLCMRIY